MTGDRKEDKLTVKRILKTGDKQAIQDILKQYFLMYQKAQIRPSKYEFIAADLDGGLPILTNK